MSDRWRLALCWGSTCGGCDIAVLDLHGQLLDLAGVVDIVLWPMIMDFKYPEVESWPDQYVDVCLFNGAIRNSQNERMAHLLRQKSRVLVALGSCACFGGIPGLANVASRNQVFDRVYRAGLTANQANQALPSPRTTLPEGKLVLPFFWGTVRSLGQVEDVDYFLPGCPPPPERIWDALCAIRTGNLPPRGAAVGVSGTTVCEECTRRKGEKSVERCVRPHLVQADPERCFLEQGLICLGPATQGGCGARCLQAWMPCRGCYGPTESVSDQGAKMLSALASILDAEDEGRARQAADSAVDLLGTFYRYSLPTSLLERVRLEDQADEHFGNAHGTTEPGSDHDTHHD